MHGFSSIEEEETERMSKERRTEERGSFASGEASCFLGDGGACCSKLLVSAASDDLALLVRLTNLAVR